MELAELVKVQSRFLLTKPYCLKVTDFLTSISLLLFLLLQIKN